MTATDLNSLTFSWGEVPCGDRRGVITQYFYQLSDVNDVPMASVNGDTSNRNVTIQNGLSQCATYRFRVRANPNGPFSDPVEAMTTSSGKCRVFVLVKDTVVIKPQSMLKELS